MDRVSNDDVKTPLKRCLMEVNENALDLMEYGKHIGGSLSHKGILGTCIIWYATSRQPLMGAGDLCSGDTEHQDEKNQGMLGASKTSEFGSAWSVI